MAGIFVCRFGDSRILDNHLKAELPTKRKSLFILTSDFRLQASDFWILTSVASDFQIPILSIFCGRFSA
jgi:hypothetical protein